MNKPAGSLSNPPVIEREEKDDVLILHLKGDWVIANGAALFTVLQQAGATHSYHLHIDGTELGRLDTIGALMVNRLIWQHHEEVALGGFDEDRMILIEEVAERYEPADVEPERENALTDVLRRIGENTVLGLGGVRSGVGFLGLTFVTTLRALLRPGHMRWAATVKQMEYVGFNALPIVGLISFLIGVVIAYQGAAQLRFIGFDVYTVDLVAISVSRELGILLTAIMVAGRSGSAFTAEIGSMKLHEEVDALRALGVDPIEVLVVPRVLALTLIMPILAFYAALMGMFGGMMISWGTLDIAPITFVERAHEALTGWDVGVGIIKAPVFGAIIALIGAYEGLRVKDTAESLGTQTTKSVVESVFLVIVLDAVFAVFFTEIGI